MNLCCPNCGSLIAMIDPYVGLYCTHCWTKLRSIQFDTWDMRGIPPTNPEPPPPIRFGESMHFNEDVVVDDPSGRFSVCHAARQSMSVARKIQDQKIKAVQVTSMDEVINNMMYYPYEPMVSAGNPIKRDYWIKPTPAVPRQGGWFNTGEWGKWPEKYFNGGTPEVKQAIGDCYSYTRSWGYAIKEVKTVEEFIELKKKGVAIYANVPIPKPEEETGGDKGKDKPAEGKEAVDEVGFERSDGILLESWESFAKRKAIETFGVPEKVIKEDKDVQ